MWKKKLNLKVKFCWTFILVFLPIISICLIFDFDDLWPWHQGQTFRTFIFAFLAILGIFQTFPKFDLDLWSWPQGQVFLNLYFCVSSHSEHFTKKFKIWPWWSLTSRSNFFQTFIFVFLVILSIFQNLKKNWPWWPLTLNCSSNCFGPLLLYF